jgi:hypothetical protein
LSPIIATLWVKYEGLDFDGIGEKPMTMKTTFLNVEYMLELVSSSRERAIVSEGGSQLPPYPSCGRLKKENNENILKTHPTPSLKRRDKPINYGEKKKKSQRYSSNKTSLVSSRREAIKL